MFVSNNTRFRRMRKYNKQLQENIDDTQIKLYNYLAQQQQTDQQANQYAEMASRIGTRLIHSIEEKPTGELTGLGKLFKAINEGKLDQFIQSFQHIPSSGLSAVARVAQSVIQTKDFKQEVNMNLKKLVEVGETQPKKIASALIQELAKNPKFQERVRMQDEESVSSNESLDDVAEGAIDELSTEGPTIEQLRLNMPNPKHGAYQESEAPTESTMYSEDDFKSGEAIVQTKTAMAKLNKADLLFMYKHYHPDDFTIEINGAKKALVWDKLGPNEHGKNITSVKKDELKPIVERLLYDDNRLGYALS